MLKDNIARKMREQGEGFRCSDLSRRTNIHHDTLLQILKGNTKNPNVQTIAKVAQALNSSIDELMGLPPKDFSYNTKIDNISLFYESVSFVLKKIKSCSGDVYFAGFLKSVFDIYYYSKEQGQIDVKFAEWCVDTHLLSMKNSKFSLR